MNKKITVKMDSNLLEVLSRIGGKLNVTIDELLTAAAYNMYVNDYTVEFVNKQEILLFPINDWLDSIRDGKATDEQFKLSSEAGHHLQNLKYERYTREDLSNIVAESARKLQNIKYVNQIHVEDEQK
jgi:hypothetical protein